MRILGAILMVLVATHAQGQEKVIKACFTKWSPYSYVKDEQPAGLSIEIYSAAIKQAGLEISYEYRPWKRCITDFAKGRFDALVDGDIEIPKSLYAKQRPIPWVMLFWVHEKSPYQEYLGYSQFDNQNVGYMRGYGYPKDFLKHKGFDKTDVTDDLQGLRMLDKRRFEVFIGDIVNNAQLVETHNLNVRAIGPALQVKTLTLIFSDRLPEKHKKFETALNQMYKDGSINLFYKKYLGVTYEEFNKKHGIK